MIRKLQGTQSLVENSKSFSLTVQNLIYEEMGDHEVTKSLESPLENFEKKLLQGKES